MCHFSVVSLSPDNPGTRWKHFASPTYTISSLVRHSLSAKTYRMGQALQVDHEKVKMVALQIGVREAARQFNLPEPTVQAWSRREGWFAQAVEARNLL